MLNYIPKHTRTPVSASAAVPDRRHRALHRLPRDGGLQQLRAQHVGGGVSNRAFVHACMDG